MLNLNCVICAELFAPSDDVRSTNCGHMFHNRCLQQWLERSKSCPQCRNKCTSRNTFRLYFNLANLDTSQVDVGNLQEQLDNVKLQLKLKESELKSTIEQNDKMKETLVKSKVVVNGLEKKIEEKNFVIQSYAEQLKLMKTNVKIIDDLRNEIKSLKDEIVTMNSLKILLSASTADAEAMLKNERDAKTLCILATTLKKELRLCQSKKNEIHSALKRSQNELHKLNQEKRTLEERMAQLESENYQLNEKFKIKKTDTEESPEGSYMEMQDEKLMRYLNEVKKSDRRSTISPTIKENIKKIEDSDSPYLNIKSSSIGLTSLFNRQFDPTKSKKLKPNSFSPKKTQVKSGLKKTSSDLSEKYSIFNKSRFSSFTSQTMKPLPSNVVFNGFGGTERMDPFAARDFSDEVVQKSEEPPTKQMKRFLTSEPKNVNLPIKKLRPFTESIEID